MAQYQPMYDSFSRTPERYVPTARMGVSSSVFLPGSEIDFATGRLKPDHQRRHRTQAQKLEQKHLGRKAVKANARLDEAKKGRGRIELWIALVTFVFFCCALGVVYLTQLGIIGRWQGLINDQEALIDEYRQANLQLEEQLAAASDPAVICYAASQELNMIPADSIKAIELPAPDTRPLETAKRQRQMAGAAAQAEHVQNTPVPMTASN